SVEPRLGRLCRRHQARVRSAASRRSQPVQDHSCAPPSLSAGTGRPRSPSTAAEPQRLGGGPVDRRFAGRHTLVALALAAKSENRREAVDIDPLFPLFWKYGNIIRAACLGCVGPGNPPTRIPLAGRARTSGPSRGRDRPPARLAARNPVV